MGKNKGLLDQELVRDPVVLLKKYLKRGFIVDFLTNMAYIYEMM